MTTPTEAPREALPEPLKVVAWITTRTTDGKKMLEEPCITTNPAYVRVHREWDWRPYGVDHDQAQSALESERQAHAAEVERLRARLAFLTQPGALRFVEEDSGMYRVYEDEAPPERETHFWQSVTSLYYPSAAEAIDAAIDQAIARGKT